MLSVSPYDDTDYIEDRQYCYNGSEQHPEFTNHHVLKPKLKEKSLKPDLINAGFPAEIVTKANEIFNKLECGLKRGVRRRQLMFFCVQSAYNKLKIPEDPSRLATMCGISHSEMMKANSMCSPSKTNYKAPLTHWTPHDFLSVFYQKLVDLDIIMYSDSVFEDIESICNEVMDKSPTLREDKPQTVAAAILVYYLGLHGIGIDKKSYSEIFSRSDMTIQKVKNKVAQAYNS